MPLGPRTLIVASSCSDRPALESPSPQGFTHATADPSFLIGVANHFYKDVKAEWLCLGMTRAALSAANITPRLRLTSKSKALRRAGRT